MSDQPSKPVEYRPVPGCPAYRVGDDGTVWTRYVFGSNTCRLGEWVKMDPFQRKNGYFQVHLRVNKKRIIRRVHHLVLISFGFEKPFPSAVTRHLNGNPADNRLSNLKWGTGKENQNDRIAHGTEINGEKCHLSKLTEDDVYKIRNLYAKMRNVEIGKIFGVHEDTIFSIKKRRTWKHVH